MAVGASMTAPDPTNVLPPRPIRAAQVLTEAEAKADLARFGEYVPKAQLADSTKAAGHEAHAIVPERLSHVAIAKLASAHH